jgi:hypothetical protein
MTENIVTYDREKNLRKLKDKYNTDRTKARESLMKTAKNSKLGNGNTEYKDPSESFIKFGDY